MDGAAARVAESEAGAERIKTARGEAKRVILDAAQDFAVEGQEVSGCELWHHRLLRRRD
jgi:hypothetical protein